MISPVHTHNYQSIVEYFRLKDNGTNVSLSSQGGLLRTSVKRSLSANLLRAALVIASVALGVFKLPFLVVPVALCYLFYKDAVVGIFVENKDPLMIGEIALKALYHKKLQHLVSVDLPEEERQTESASTKQPAPEDNVLKGYDTLVSRMKQELVFCPPKDQPYYPPREVIDEAYSMLNNQYRSPEDSSLKERLAAKRKTLETEFGKPSGSYSLKHGVTHLWSWLTSGAKKLMGKTSKINTLTIKVAEFLFGREKILGVHVFLYQGVDAVKKRDFSLYRLRQMLVPVLFVTHCVAFDNLDRHIHWSASMQEKADAFNGRGE